MRNNFKLINLTGIIASFLIIGLYIFVNSSSTNSTHNELSKEFWSTKKSKVKAGEQAFQKPDGYLEYFSNISKQIDEPASRYGKGYRGRALANASINKQRRANLFDVVFTSRGPGNVGGRTRAIAVDPDDASHCTWIAGAAGGGIWKTENCGISWTNISEGLPNLSTNSIAQSISNPEVIYVGTGEVFAGNSTFIRGDGIYKSSDRGASWTLLSATVDNVNYTSVNRIAIDPADENIVVIATNSGIYKSTDGGASWVETYKAPVRGSVQDLQVDPTNYSIQYAGVNSNGIFKSIDAGNTWVKASSGITDGLRFEIAVAPSNPNVVYTSSYVGSTTLLYYSDDKAENWVKVIDDDFDTNFLGAQGWYDNAIEVNPYNPNEVFVGGVNIGKFLIDPNNVSETAPTFLGLDELNTSFLDFVSFSAEFNGGTLSIADGNLSPSQQPVTVEVRWGAGNTQKAHRFVVPANGGTNGDGGAGISTNDYVYQDYVDVPFEVWDVVNNRQLMVSFRDQQNDGEFNLNPRDPNSDPQLLTSREYLYIHDLSYSPTAANDDVTNTVGGVQFANMYYVWPVLTTGESWTPESFTDAVLRINYGSQMVASSVASAVYDAYGNYNRENQQTLHPDHHNLTFIKTNEAKQEFMVVNGNDGSFGYSSDNGVTFSERETGYVTSQFYGADKKPGEDKYIGGTQDNGTWVSVGSTVEASSSYDYVLGGDGFEVLWHAKNTELVLATIYNNRIYASTDGGRNFSSSSNGIAQEDGPFITRLANSTTSPDIVYAIGNDGVYRSTNFGANWSMKVIDAPTWGANNSSNDLEVSLANDSIVWAGAGMFAGALDIFVSKDRGENFSPVNIPNIDPRAYTTGIYTHPSDENTAYVLFSVANKAKILRTEDLGQSWTDISGFGTGTSSSNGFPDVFTHCLLVMPFNTEVIWAGTEIGLFESLDGGGSWNLRTDMPSASIWSMKAVDDQIVIGTHGRGIWTATISDLKYALSRVTAFDYMGYGKANLNINIKAPFDSVSVYIGDSLIEVLKTPNVGDNNVSLNDFYQYSPVKFIVKSALDGVEYISEYDLATIDRAPKVLDYSTTIDLQNDTYPILIELDNNDPFSKIDVSIDGEIVHTDTQQLLPSDDKRVVSFDYSRKGVVNVLLNAYLDGYVFQTEINRLVTSTAAEIQSKLKVYPVPANNTIYVELTGGEIYQYQIFTAAGKLMKSNSIQAKKSISIDIVDLQPGVYLLQLKDGKGSISTKRFIKK